MSTYILVPGAWHGAWCWYKLAPLLRRAGHKAIAIDLPGLGRDRTPLPEVSLQSFVDRVCSALDEHPGRAVLVGHGRGGIVISQVAEQRPAKIQALIYLCAFSIPHGKALLPTAMYDSRSVLVQNVVVDEEQGCLTVKQDVCREALYGDCSDQDIALATSLLTPEPLAPSVTPLDLSEPNFGRAPRVYIETLCDSTLTLSVQRKMVAALPCAEVISMNTGHAPFFSAPTELAGHLVVR